MTKGAACKLPYQETGAHLSACHPSSFSKLWETSVRPTKPHWLLPAKGRTNSPTKVTFKPWMCLRYQKFGAVHTTNHFRWNTNGIDSSSACSVTRASTLPVRGVLNCIPRKRNCSVGCAPRFASERRIKVDETTCEWQIMHNGRSNGIYISNFKNVDEESEEFITHNADQVSERSDGRYTFTVLVSEREVEFPDTSEIAGEKYITNHVDHDKVFDRDDFFGPQLKNSSIRVCDHLKFPEHPDLWDMVYCKVMNHPENLSCHKCANVPRHCDKCDSIFDFNVQPLDMLGELSERYVIL
ncbi:hypothetical protein I7I48_07702 [Histoplasma ohiense]|nr:hypothetical protein I7I48_07702 [Histoplasma ohiense (nom. inval.)]